MNKKEWTVLLIEDDPMVQEVNRQFIEQVEGFIVIAAASNGLEGVQLIKQHQPDLTIIDMYMPSQDGLTTLQQIRANGYKTDVIAVTAASDIETVRKVLQYGAVDYIMKPFKFERMKQALEQYRSFQVKISQKEHITQSELDSMLFQQFEEKADLLPKGLNAVTLRRIQQYLSEQNHPISAVEGGVRADEHESARCVRDHRHRLQHRPDAHIRSPGLRGADGQHVRQHRD